ncbi:MAG: PEP-CTERM sorting domain-containing protein, partial [Planctomycetota bacterium]
APGIDPTAALGFAADHYDGALGFSTDANNDRAFATTGQTIFFQVNVQDGATLNLEALDFVSLKTRGDNRTGSRVTHTLFVNPTGDPAVDGLAGDFDFLLAQAHSHVATGETGQSFGDNFTTGRWQANTVDLSAFEDLTGVNTIAIRMHASEGLDRDFGIDNIVLRGRVFGATAIPEPSTALVLLLGSSVLFGRRKR